MRTLALLAAFLLLAVLAQAQTKLRMGQQDLEQYQPMAKGQDQGGTEDQDVVITLKGEDHHSKGVAGYYRKKICTCRTGHFCRIHESHSGSCKLYGTKSKLCCH